MLDSDQDIDIVDSFEIACCFVLFFMHDADWQI